MDLELDDSEQALLLEILKSRRGSLREEIYHATTTDFKIGLKETQRTLQRLIEKTERPTPRGPALGRDIEMTQST